MHSTKTMMKPEQHPFFFLAPSLGIMADEIRLHNSWLNWAVNVLRGVLSHTRYCLRSCVMLTNPPVAAVT